MYGNYHFNHTIKFSELLKNRAGSPLSSCVVPQRDRGKNIVVLVHMIRDDEGLGIQENERKIFIFRQMVLTLKKEQQEYLR